jgi:hypothetical protein
MRRCELHGICDDCDKLSGNKHPHRLFGWFHVQDKCFDFETIRNQTEHECLQLLNYKSARNVGCERLCNDDEWLWDECTDQRASHFSQLRDSDDCEVISVVNLDQWDSGSNLDNLVKMVTVTRE